MPRYTQKNNRLKKTRKYKPTFIFFKKASTGQQMFTENTPSKEKG